MGETVTLEVLGRTLQWQNLLGEGEVQINLVNKSRSQMSATRGFPGGAVVKNPPANAGFTGSSPGPGRPHMLRSN